MRSALASAAAMALAACSGGDVGGFDQPACALHDPVADVYLVSNVRGAPLAKDGNGYIARVSPHDGTMRQFWIEGGKNGVVLHAPKGLAIVGDVLWVADIDVLRAFDRTSGAARGEIAIPGTTALTDLAAGVDGELFVSDAGVDAAGQPNGNDAIWRVRPPVATSGSLANLADLAPRVAPLARGAELGQPRALAVHKDGVYFVGGRDGSFELVDARGTRTLLARCGEPLDGLARIEPRPGESPVWLATSTAGNCLWQFDLTGGVTKLPRVLDAPGDCGFDAVRRRLLVPSCARNRLDLVQL